MPVPRTRRAPALLAMAALCGVLVAATACSNDDEAETPATTTVPLPAQGPPPGDALRFGVVGLEHLDPAFVLPGDQSGMVAIDLLFDGLTAWDPVMSAPVPGLATWTVDPSLTTWTFELRDGLTFSDGSPLAASDVKASLDRVARLGDLSLAGVRLDVIDGRSDVASGATAELTGVEVVDERTLVIRTTQPYAALPELLSSPLYGVVPSDADAVTGFDATPVGSGPYRVAGRDGGLVRLEPVDGGDRPAIELAIYPDATAAFSGFSDGLTDWSIVPAGQLDEAEATFGREAVAPQLVQLFYGFNLRDPVLSDLALRRAVVQAVDRQALLDTILESGDPLDGVLPPSVPGAVADACGSACAFDPGAARLAIAAIEAERPLPVLSIDVYDDPVERAVAELIAGDLRAVGLRVDVAVLAFDEYRSFVVSGDQQVFTFGWAGVAPDGDVFLAPLLDSASPDNPVGLADPVVDLAIRAARAEPDRDQRLALYGEIDRAAMTQVPILPIAAYRTATVIGDRVAGYVPRPDGTFVADSLRLVPSG